MILNFNNFGFLFRKMNIFWGMKILLIYFWCHHKTGLVLGLISMHFRTFSEGQCTEWKCFWVLKFQIYFGGCLIFLIFVFHNLSSRCWVQTYVSRKNKIIPPPYAPTINQVIMYYISIMSYKMGLFPFRTWLDKGIN